MAEDDPDRRPRAFLMINMEMDGEDITRHSMRELSAVLFLDDKSVIAEFDVKLKAIEGRCVDERCMSTFWEHQQDAWGWVLADAFTPNQAMARFAHFLTVHGVTYSIRCVAAPASQDFPWLKEYYGLFAPIGSPRLHWFCYCLHTMRHCYKRIHGLSETDAWRVRKEMQDGLPSNTHRAVETARAQLVEFCNMRTALSNTFHVLSSATVPNHNLPGPSSTVTDPVIVVRHLQDTQAQLTRLADRVDGLHEVLQHSIQSRQHQQAKSLTSSLSSSMISSDHFITEQQQQEGSNLRGHHELIVKFAEVTTLLLLLFSYKVI